MGGGVNRLCLPYSICLTSANVMVTPLHFAHMSLLSNNEIHGVDFFSELVHLSTLFAKNLKDIRKKENMKKKDSFLSTYHTFE